MSVEWDGAPSRRRFLALGAEAALGLAAPAIIGASEASAAALRANRTPQILNAPNLAWGQQGMRCVAGVRPGRTGGLKIGPDMSLSRNGQSVFHNYGHGGGGITLSLGCAMQVGDDVAKNILARGANASLPTVAVIGSGVAGLTVARELKNRWPQIKIRILTKSQNVSDCTSNLAGGQFAPSGIFNEYDRAGTMSTLLPLMQKSRARLKEFFDRGTNNAYGIRERYNYSAKELPDFKAFQPAVYAPPLKGTLPFRGGLGAVAGYEYGTWLIEPPIFLEAVRRELVGKGVMFRWGYTVGNLSALQALPERIVVNCTGLGARDLVSDRSMHPIKGHLVILPNSSNLKYFFSGCIDGANASYFFGRTNDMVVGGTYFVDNDSTNVDPATCRAILLRTCLSTSLSQN